MSRRIIVGACLLLVFFVLQDVASGDNWAGWRGDGSGVSKETGLPAKWAPNQNLLWKTPIEGDGISSPIVWGNRVYVTTAVQGRETAVSRKVVGGVAIVLLGLAVLFTLFSLRGRKGLLKEQPGLLRAATVLDRLAIAFTGLAFLYVSYKFIAKLMVAEELFSEGNVLYSWKVSGVSAAIGLIVAFGVLPVHSLGRVLGALVLVVGAFCFHIFSPRDIATTPVPFTELVLLSAPAFLAAGWFFIVWLYSRPYKADGSPLRAPAALACCSLLILSGLTFTYFNYLQPKTGLTRSLVCLDRDSGEVLWMKSGGIWPAGRRYYSNSYATPTPVTDGEVIVADFGPAVVCFDMEGTVKWVREELLYETYLRYGASSGPALYGDRVLYVFIAENPEAGVGGSVEYEFKNYSYIRAANKLTGETIWQATPPGAHDSYGTPVVLTSAGRPVAVLTGYDHVSAYDVETGEQAWIVKLPLTQPVPSVIGDATHTYVTGGIHGDQLAARIKLGGSGDVTESHVEWKENTKVNDCASPVLYEGLLYWVTSKTGAFYCKDAKTGNEIYKKRLRGSPNSSFMNSLVAGDGKIYVTNSFGESWVLKAGAEARGEFLSENSIGEECGSSLAISDGRIFVRGKDHLFCFGRKKS